MNSRDVAKVEPELTHSDDSAGIYTSVFFHCVPNGIVVGFRFYLLIFFNECPLWV